MTTLREAVLAASSFAYQFKEAALVLHDTDFGDKGYYALMISGYPKDSEDSEDSLHILDDDVILEIPVTPDDYMEKEQIQNRAILARDAYAKNLAEMLRLE